MPHWSRVASVIFTLIMISILRYSFGYVSDARCIQIRAVSSSSSSRAHSRMLAKKQAKKTYFSEVILEESQGLGSLEQKDSTVDPSAVENWLNHDYPPALVLNADYTPLSLLPLSLWSWQESLRAVLSGKAVVVTAYDKMIRSVSLSLQMPSVIALKHYHAPHQRTPAMSRRNIYLRDGYKCQYCMQRFPPIDLSLDHVVPRSRGGKLTWLNTVTACKGCNFKKGHLSVDEISRIGMKLRNLPKIPTSQELQAKSRLVRRTVLHPHWNEYIP